jgi:hypothetical protein
MKPQLGPGIQLANRASVFFSEIIFSNEASVFFSVCHQQEFFWASASGLGHVICFGNGTLAKHDSSRGLATSHSMEWALCTTGTPLTTT